MSAEIEGLRNVVREMVKTPEGAAVLAEMPAEERDAFLHHLGFDTVPIRWVTADEARAMTDPDDSNAGEDTP